MASNIVRGFFCLSLRNTLPSGTNVNQNKALVKEIFHKIDDLIEKAKNQNSQIVILKSQLTLLTKKAEEQAKIIADQKNTIENYREQQKIATLAGRFEQIGQTDKATLKRQISELIKEIDRGIEFLDQ